MLLWSLKSSKTKTLFNVKPQSYCISDLLVFFTFSKMRHLSLLVVCLRQMLFRSIMSFSRFYRKEGFRFLRFPNQHPTCFMSVFLLSFFLSIYLFVCSNSPILLFFLCFFFCRCVSCLGFSLLSLFLSFCYSLHFFVLLILFLLSLLSMILTTMSFTLCARVSFFLLLF
jgi:hypothetical protein